MKGVAKNLLSLAAAVLVFFVAKYAVMGFQGRDPVATTSNTYEQMEANAVASRPDLPKSIAVREEAREQAQGVLSGSPTVAQRERNAADIFWSFYFLNTRARAAYCTERGVDIAPFVAAFSKAHAMELGKAKAIYRRDGASEDAQYRQGESVAAHVVADDMKGVAGLQGMSEAEACQLFADRADEVVQKVLLANVSPPVYETLASAER